MDNPGLLPLTNGPIRTVSPPGQPHRILDSDRCELEFLLPFPFHAVDPKPWPPIRFLSNGVPITVERPTGVAADYDTRSQVGNERADAYCTVVRLSTPVSNPISADDGWAVVKRLLQWIRVKSRHYWLLHGVAGFGAEYRGSLFVRDGSRLSQQNVALYQPRVIVGPLTNEIWSSTSSELETGEEAPLADSLYCDALLSIAAGDTTKALLEAGVAMEVGLTKLLVDVAESLPITPPKSCFVHQKGDRDKFSKKLCSWPKRLGLDPVENFALAGMPTDWHKTAKGLYRLRNGVAHGGSADGDFGGVVNGMFAAGVLLEYCRAQRLNLGLSPYSMPAGVTPWHQVEFCHDARIGIDSGVARYTVQS